MGSDAGSGLAAGAAGVGAGLVAMTTGAGAAVGFALWFLDELGNALGSTSAVAPEPAAHAGLALVGISALVAWIRAFRRGVAD